MKLVTLKQYMIDRLGENPECRGCGYILYAGEKVYIPWQKKPHTNYFCRDCIENREFIIYPIHNRGRQRAPVNVSLPYNPKRPGTTKKK